MFPMLLAQVVQTPTPPPVPEIPDWIFSRGPDPIEIAIAVVIVVASLGGLGMLWMLVRGLVRKWTQSPVGQETIDGLKRSVQQLSAEVGELHERMDFAERMLAAHRDPARLERRGD
jgi:hypothetical protein